MLQTHLYSSAFEVTGHRTRKRVFLEQMEQLVPWSDLLARIEPHYPKVGTSGGRPAMPLAMMLRIHFLQQWFGLSDPAMQEALHDVPLYREFAGVELSSGKLPDESTILRFRHLLEIHKLAEQILACINQQLVDKGLMLREGTVVDATLIAAPSSTKNKEGQRDPEMKQSKKGNNYYFGMKGHIGVDMHSGAVHTVIGTAGNVHDVTQAHALLHGDEREAAGDAGYRGVEKRPEADKDKAITWHIAMRPGKRKQLDKTTHLGQLQDKLETVKAQIRARVEHPFRMLKCRFGYRKVKYRGLEKNTQNLKTLFALANLCLLRKPLLNMMANGA